jgi:hypothetical protein
MTTKSSKPPLEPIQRTIEQLVAYLNSSEERDISVSGLLNWFSMLRRDNGESVFTEKGLLKPKYRDQYVERLKEMIAGNVEGRAYDGVIMGVANDLLAQIETAVNFRRLKIGHHFAKSRYNIESMGKGAVEPKNSDSILEEYTSVFLENAEKYTA